MYVVGSIIARLGSKRLKDKNLMSIEGKPLVGSLKRGEYPKIYLTSLRLNPFKKRGYPVDKHLTRLPSRFARERPQTI